LRCFQKSQKTIQCLYSVIKTAIKFFSIVDVCHRRSDYIKLNTVLSCLGVFTFCTCCKILICFVCIVASFKWYCVYCCWLAVCIVVVVLCVFVVLCALLFFCTLDAGLLARSQYSEGPATGHLDTGFSWFPCVYKQTLRRFPTFQVATTCFSCSSPDLNLVVTNFMFRLHVK